MFGIWNFLYCELDIFYTYTCPRSLSLLLLLCMNRLVENLKHLDWLLIISVVILLALGLSAIYSVDLGKGTGDFLKTKRQAVSILIGGVLFLGMCFFNYKRFLRYSLALYGLSMVVLSLLLLFGQRIRGARAWFHFGPFSLQPVEFVKIAIILVLAKYFSEHLDKRFSFRFVLESGLLTALPAGLIMLQPDFGSAALVVLIWVFMLLVVGIPKKYILALGGLFLILAVLGWSFFLQDYQKNRLLTFINPLHDTRGAGYNIKQAIIAIGAGKLFGRGLGFGSQTQLKFLPESQTDFIFAVIAEELGFILVMIIFLSIMLMFYRLWTMMKNVNDNFSLFIILGAAFLLCSQMVITIGMNIGLLPVTGLTLPFVSYGGSSLLAHAVLLGIVQNIKMNSRRESRARDTEYML